MIDLPDSAVFAAATSDFRFVLALAVGLLTGFVRGFSGFGSALIYVPLMSAVYDPRISIVTFVMQDLVTGYAFLAMTWRKTHWGEVLPMAVCALFAAQFGALILQRADPVMLRWALCVLVAVVVVVLASGWRYHGRPRLAVTIGVGLLSGLIGGAVQISGPPVIIYWLGSAHAAEVLRANFFAYFSLFSTASFVTYLVHGLVTAQIWAIATFVVPTCILGMWLGTRAFGFATERVYRRVAYVIVAVSAVISMPLWDGILH